MTRTCADCAAQIDPRSTRCRPCFNARLSNDPAVSAKKAATMRQYLADPANRDALRRRARTAAVTRWSNPEYAKRARKWFVEVARPMSMSNPHATECRRKAAYASAESRLAWCPVERRDEYRRMVRGGTKAVDARRIMLARIEADEKARIAAMSPFERQERALANGAGLVANVRVAVR